jgi:NAD(P)-dependent dehydrogenase (short-subunit alcohol dehydrogenase family)
VDLGFKNRIAVVTGGSSGSGLVAARLLLGEGARVAICGRDANRLETAKRELMTLPGADVLAQSCDVLNRADVERFAHAVAAWSGDKVDVLVNNAGQGRVSTFATTSDDDWRQELELKIFSQTLPIQVFKSLLERSDAPAIVGVNSLLALQPEPHMVATAAARASVQSLLKSLSVEFAPRIRVNSILLGLVESGQWQRRFETRADKAETRDAWFANLARSKHIPLGRLGQPEEAARAILFLGSPVASYITGASLEISGGVSRHI